jgi:tungstate transport system substrate-binding protein
MRWHGLVWLAITLVGCAQPNEATQTLTLATTTSTRDSGLLGALVPFFERETGIQVKVVAVGTGQALELGRRGDADVLLTHAPAAEQKFMDEGYGQLRRAVMRNDFVLVGPPSDPAKVGKATAIGDAFRCLAQSRAPFVSRDDDSGTHMKEQAIWQAANIQPDGEWYIRAGAAMAAALRMANEKQAYTLSDRGTYLAHEAQLELTIVSQGDPLLHNPYSVIVVSSETHPDINRKAAQQFAEFLVSPQAQSIIREFGIDQYGQPLFFTRAETQLN